MYSTTCGSLVLRERGLDDGWVDGGGDREGEKGLGKWDVREGGVHLESKGRLPDIRTGRARLRSCGQARLRSKVQPTGLVTGGLRKRQERLRGKNTGKPIPMDA